MQKSNCMEKISVIVPVYKVEKFLDQCVSSIVNQSYKNLEIILVDDGSPDNCPAMCDGWAERDNRIKVIHKENGGLSSARNAGIDVATGDYITFVDSDDYLPKSAILSLLTAFSYPISKIGSVAGQIYQDINGRVTVYNSSWNVDKTKILRASEFRDNALLDKSINTAWGKLYKKDIFKYVHFREGKLNEDTLFTYDVSNIYEKEQWCEIIIPKYTYFYRLREDSICTSKDNILLVSVLENKLYVYEEYKLKKSSFADIYYIQYVKTLFMFCVRLFKDENLKKRFFDKYSNDFSEIPLKIVFKSFRGSNLIKAMLFRCCPKLVSDLYNLKKTLID